MTPIRDLPTQYRCECHAQRIIYRTTAAALFLSVIGVTLAMLRSVAWLIS